MLEFDQAVSKLNRDHANLRKNAIQRRSTQRQLERNRKSRLLEQRRQRDKLLLQEKRQLWCQRYMEDWEHGLNIVDLYGIPGSESKEKFSTLAPLKAVSVWGDGDRITLPVSLLSELTERELLTSGGGKQQPLSFRIGILNAELQSSLSHQPKSILFTPDLVRASEAAIPTLSKEDDNDSGYKNTKMDTDENEGDKTDSSLYLHELNHRYRSYTYGTVLEFTAEEGCIGIPATIAKTLLQQRIDGAKLDSTFTRDPAQASLAKQQQKKDSNELIDMATEPSSSSNNETERIPGHIAYEAFPIPCLPLTIQLATPPRGTACILRPLSPNTFHRIPNVKISLEQSIIQTRATLNVGQEIDCWYRGHCEKLLVDKVTPEDFRVVGCVDTDITVEFSSSNLSEDQGKENVVDVDEDAKQDQTKSSGGYTLGGKGRTLQNESINNAPKSIGSSDAMKNISKIPPQQHQTTDISPPLTISEPSAPSGTTCRILIRGQYSSMQRLFNIKTTTKSQLFHYISLQGALYTSKDEHQKQDDEQKRLTRKFQLVTRYPRTVMALDEKDDSTNQQLLISCGVKGGINAQMMYIMEWM